MDFGVGVGHVIVVNSGSLFKVVELWYTFGEPFMEWHLGTSLEYVPDVLSKLQAYYSTPRTHFRLLDCCQNFDISSPCDSDRSHLEFYISLLILGSRLQSVLGASLQIDQKWSYQNIKRTNRLLVHP